MAVAFDTSAESHTGTSGSSSQASFDFTITPAAGVKGLLVFTFVNANADDALSVKINPAGANIDVPAVSGGRAVDTATEPGDCKAWFLGSGLPAGGSAWTIRVNRNNNANVMYAVAITVTATGDTQVHAAGIVLLQNDGSLAEQSVTDGSPGSNSVRFAGANYGGASPPGTGASSTLLQSIDFTARAISTVRETTAGQGARNVGFSAASDDRAAVHLAVKEAPFAYTLDAGSGSYSIAGATAELLVGRALAADAGTYAISGAAATLAYEKPMDAASGAYAVSGEPATVLIARLLATDAGVYSISGLEATLEVALPADAGSYVISGAEATLVVTGVGIAMAADPGAYVLSGAVAGPSIAYLLGASSGEYVLAGTEADLEVVRIPPHRPWYPLWDPWKYPGRKRRR